MAPIKQLNWYNSNYPDTEYTSDWIYVADINNYNINVLCSSNCTLKLNYSMDIANDIVNTQTFAITSNQLYDFIERVKTAYFQIVITGITIGSILSIQSFYH